MRKFSNLNEYGGPGKTAGFRYSKPNIEYLFTCNIEIGQKIDSKHAKEYIGELLKELKVNEDWYKLTKSFDNQLVDLMNDLDVYQLQISLTVYNYLEVESMIDSMVNIIKDDGLSEIFVFDFSSINIDGDDLVDGEVFVKGFKMKNEK